MTSKDLLWKRKYQLQEYMDSLGFEGEVDLSEVDFDVTKFKTAAEVGGRLFLLFTWPYCVDKRTISETSNWIRQEGLWDFLIDSEKKYLSGKGNAQEMPRYTTSIATMTQLVWALDDLAGADIDLKEDIIESMRTTIPLGLSIQPKLSQLTLRDKEEILIGYAAYKIVSEIFLDDPDVDQQMLPQTFDSFRTLSWITGIDSEVLARIPEHY